MQTEKIKYCLCRWAPSLGELEAKHYEIWGTLDYKYNLAEGYPCVFFGLYGLKDFYELWRYPNKKYILWAGSDIRHFADGYWLDDKGLIRIDNKGLAEWINTYCESYVENEVEQAVLESVGIQSKVVPSFLGDVTKFEVSYKHSDKPKLYTSVSGDDFKLYGWDKIQDLAVANPEIEFHLYGNTKHPDPHIPGYLTNGVSNVYIHGRVPKEQMNEEIKEMQGALRLVAFDGFSEIIAKSLLMGQHPVSLIPYPHTLRPEQIGLIHGLTEPNYAGREWLLETVNKYPWNQK